MVSKSELVRRTSPSLGKLRKKLKKFQICQQNKNLGRKKKSKTGGEMVGPFSVKKDQG